MASLKGALSLKNSNRTFAVVKSQTKAKSKKSKSRPNISSQSKIDQRFIGYFRWARNPKPLPNTLSKEDNDEYNKVSVEWLKKKQELIKEEHAVMMLRQKLKQSALRALPDRLRIVAKQQYCDKKAKYRFYPLRILPAMERPPLPEKIDRLKPMTVFDESLYERKS